MCVWGVSGEQHDVLGLALDDWHSTWVRRGRILLAVVLERGEGVDMEIAVSGWLGQDNVVLVGR
jgi:hypothetical protein